MNHEKDFDIYLTLFSHNTQPTDAKLRICLLYKTLLPSFPPSLIPHVKLVPSFILSGSQLFLLLPYGFS